MKKLVTAFKFMAVLSVLALSSCSDENNEISKQETVQAKVTTADLQKKPLPFTDRSRYSTGPIGRITKSLEKYLKSDLQIAGVSNRTDFHTKRN